MFSVAPNHKQFDGAVVELKPAAVSLPDFGNVDIEGDEIAHSSNGVSTVEKERISTSAEIIDVEAY